MDTGTCTTIDAAVWVTPLCGGGAPPGVCFSVFQRAACYPYCLAVRQTASYNSALSLYNAPNWLDRVHLFNRDCAVHLAQIDSTITPQVPSIVMPQGIDERFRSIIESLTYGGVAPTLSAGSTQMTEYTSLQVESTLPNDWVRAAMVQPITEGVSLSCISHEFARSSAPKQVWDSTGDYGESRFRSTLGPAQPFVFAGDTILTAECEPLVNNFTAIACRVLVHRIYGGDMNQMTLVSCPPLLNQDGHKAAPRHKHKVPSHEYDVHVGHNSVHGPLPKDVTVDSPMAHCKGVKPLLGDKLLPCKDDLLSFTGSKVGCVIPNPLHPFVEPIHN